MQQQRTTGIGGTKEGPMCKTLNGKKSMAHQRCPEEKICNINVGEYHAEQLTKVYTRILLLGNQIKTLATSFLYVQLYLKQLKCID